MFANKEQYNVLSSLKVNTKITSGRSVYMIAVDQCITAVDHWPTIASRSFL